MVPKSFGGCLPAENFPRSGVERCGNGVELGPGPSREVGAFGKVLAEDSVGVLVGATLPGTVRVREEHRNPGRCRERGVGGEFLALVPGE